MSIEQDSTTTGSATEGNGARALIQTLVNAGVEVCFTNPGTSEMHFVAALDDVPEMRGILALFEGVATGAADGYGRMADKPAATLLHLGPGLGNGFANLHNARRGHTPVVNIVGDHATYHKQFDAPLESDIDSVASACSGWVHRSMTPETVASDALDAVSASMSNGGQVATLILPADVCWLPADGPETPGEAPTPAAIPDERIASAAAALTSGERCVLFIGGRAMRRAGLEAASRIAQATGAVLLSETFPARHERGAGIPSIDRLAYLAEFAEMQIGAAAHMIVVDTVVPVSFFAYPGKPSTLVPDSCSITELAAGDDDIVAALERLADAVGAPSDGFVPQPAVRPERPTGELTSQSVSEALGAVLPEGAIVADEANTSGLFAPGATAGCPPHDWLCLTGGSIGIGLPLATGAAVACPDRQVVCLQADGSALYTIQALWTQAREGLNVTTILFNNRSYAVLKMELNRVGATNVGSQARAMLDLTNPDQDFVSIARGLGVDAVRATDAADLCDQLERCFAEPGPHLIEVVIPPLGL